MKSRFDLGGQRVVITGGAGLIGQALVTAVVEHGGTAIIADLDAAAGTRTQAELAEKLGSERIDFVQVDITSPESVRGMIATVIDRHATIDGLVNNAYPRNANYGRRFEDVTYEDFCANLNLHLGGYFLVTQEAARVMVRQRHGAIVNVASIYGFMAPRFELYKDADFTSPVEYSAIKGGLLSLTKYLASYLGEHGIRVNALSPGGVYNGQPEAFVARYEEKVLVGKRMAMPDDMTGALLLLLSDAATYITGQNIVVDGGWSI